MLTLCTSIHRHTCTSFGPSSIDAAALHSVCVQCVPHHSPSTASGGTQIGRERPSGGAPQRHTVSPSSISLAQPRRDPIGAHTSPSSQSECDSQVGRKQQSASKSDRGSALHPQPVPSNGTLHSNPPANHIQPTVAQRRPSMVTPVETDPNPCRITVPRSESQMAPVDPTRRTTSHPPWLRQLS